MSALPTMRTTWRGAVAGQSKPAAPRIVAVTAGDGSVAVSWNPPAKTSVPAITRIAATAIAHQVPLVTQDRGFLEVPGLEVILV